MVLRRPPRDAVDMAPVTDTFTLQLLTINVHKGVDAWSRRSTLPALRTAIAQVGADVVCLQEVCDRGDGQSPPPAQIEALADGLWPQHAFARNAVSAAGGHGNAVLSRWPILRARNHDVSLPGDERRGLLHCEIAVPGTAHSLHLMCVHLGLREAHRRAQMARLVGLVARLPPGAPVVAAGDFNDWRRRADGLLQPCGLHDVHTRTLGSPARSFPARWPLLALDRIYVRGMTESHPVPLPRQPWRGLSDHVPVAASLSLPALAQQEAA